MFSHPLRTLVRFFNSIAALVLLNAAMLRAQTATYETATAGTSVTLSVTADGDPAPTFQWTREGVAISGATGATLTLSNVTLKDNGVYNAVATNAHGWALSNDLILTVNEVTAPTGAAPTITLQPFPSASAQVGTSLTLNVQALGDPAPIFEWRKNGAPIPGATHTSLVFPSLTLDDSATYSVVVSNSAGTVISNNSVVIVTAPLSEPSTPDEPVTSMIAPLIGNQPESRTVKFGANVVFNASATGSPAPTFQWYKNGVAIAGATSSKYTIKSATQSHAGTYTLVARNPAGSAESQPATLTVR